MDIGHDDHLWFRIYAVGLPLGGIALRLSRCRVRRGHATVADKLRVAQGAHAVKVSWWRDISEGLRFGPMSAYEVQFV